LGETDTSAATCCDIYKFEIHDEESSNPDSKKIKHRKVRMELVVEEVTASK